MNKDLEKTVENILDMDIFELQSIKKTKLMVATITALTTALKEAEDKRAEQKRALDEIVHTIENACFEDKYGLDIEMEEMTPTLEAIYNLALLKIDLSKSDVRSVKSPTHP